MSVLAPRIRATRVQHIESDGLVFPWQLLAFLAACAVLICRRPDAIFHAQFYAEGGRMWFANAYNQGWWRVLFHTYEGYFHLLPRLAGAAALLVPLSDAPLMENLIAIAVQALPVCLLLSSRSRNWGSFRFRAGLAILYLILPNAGEILGTITESQWILALCALLLLLLLGEPPRSASARVFDFSILLLCSLTGPFCIFLFPIALILLWRRRNDPWLRVGTAIFFIGSLIQGISILTHESTRTHPVLGANIEGFVRILGSQIYAGTLIGTNTLSVQLSLGALISIVIAGTAILLICARTSGTEMRALLIFSTCLFFVSLGSPVIYPPPGATAWQLLARAPSAHYWFLPCLTFAWSLAYCIRSRNQLLQIASAGLLFLMIFGVARDFRYAAFADLHYAAYARQTAAATPKSIIVIPENPHGWTLELVKH